MLENPWSAVRNPTSALGSSGSSFGLSSFAPVGIHHLLLSDLTTGVQRGTSMQLRRAGQQGQMETLTAALKEQQ